jgi:monoterpene epsilon-lactone hydrolase
MDDNRTKTKYEIRVRGLLSDRLLSAFPEMHARVRDHETVLTGDLPDQSALHGVLGRIEALGLELIEVRRARPRADARHRTSS